MLPGQMGEAGDIVLLGREGKWVLYDKGVVSVFSLDYAFNGNVIRTDGSAVKFDYAGTAVS